MISKERAIALAEAQLAREQRERPGPRNLAIIGVEEHHLGWLIFWQSAEFARTGDHRHVLLGQGPYLVDGQDGSIHDIPVVTWIGEDWAAIYLEQVRGVLPPDPLLPEIRVVLQQQGAVPAMRRLRRLAPQFTASEAKSYVDAVRGGAEPPADLSERLRPRRSLCIETIAGPA